MVYDTASAIEYLHSRSPPIIHRDIKPENLLLFGDTLKLADFGWSNLNENMRNTYCGTPDYLAPEMILRSTHNEKLDVWSLGVLTFELLTGVAPFTPPNIKERGKKMKALETNITKGNFDIPESVPQEAANLIRKALTVDPNRRISAKDFIEHEWFIKLGIAKQKSPPPQITQVHRLEPSNIVFKQVTPYKFDYSQHTNTNGLTPSYLRQENPLMRGLTPVHSRSVSRDLGIREPHRHIEVKHPSEEVHRLPAQNGIANYQSAQQFQDYNFRSMTRQDNMGTPVRKIGYTYQNFHQAAQNSTSQISDNRMNPTFTAPPGTTPHRDYRISKDDYSNHDSKQNISTDIISNDQSRIRPSPLRLRSDSKEHNYTPKAEYSGIIGNSKMMNSPGVQAYTIHTPQVYQFKVDIQSYLE